MRAVDSRNGFFEGNLARLVEDDDVEQIRIERQRVRNAERTHQPDRFQVLDDLSGVTRRQIANGFVPHRLAELVFEITPAGGVGFLEDFLLLLQPGCR